MSLPPLPDVPRHRRGTATVVAIGALALLCLLALIFGLKGLFAAPDGSPTAQRDARPQPSTAAGSTHPTPARSGEQPAAGNDPTAAGDQADLVQFESPSGNIRCAISSAGARCDIASKSWKPPPEPESCTLDWGAGLFVDADRAGVVCAGDTVDGGPELAYGKAESRGDFRCDSRKDGVTCRHEPSGHSFTIARADYQLS